jgi:spore coat protein U-like protein
MKKLLNHTAAALALLASGNVLAAGQTLLEDIAVTATVTEACSALTATDVDFGAQPQTETDSNATSTITVTCASGTPYTVELDYGASTIPPIRQVTGAGGEFMDYYIYKDSGHTVDWGTVADGTALAGSGTGAADPLTAYFVLDRNSGASPGTYTDLVGVTLNF